jgi:hypothetical protein
LTPGSIWNGLTAFPDNADDVPEFIQESQIKFKSAKNIVLVGGGAVGIGQYIYPENVRPPFNAPACQKYPAK